MPPNEPSPPAADGRRTRWDAHRVARRHQLVEAALAVLADVGPEFGLDQVAERAGVTKPVIYRHFADRAGLVEAMGERATAVMLDDWILPALRADAAPLPRIRSSVDGFLGFLEHHPNVYWLYVLHAPAEGSDVATMNKELIAAAISAVLGEFFRAGGVSDEVAGVWGHGLVGFVQNAAEWWLVRGSMHSDELAGHLTDLVWAQCDGMLRRYGVALDPHTPLTPGHLARLAAEQSRGGGIG